MIRIGAQSYDLKLCVRVTKKDWDVTKFIEKGMNVEKLTTSRVKLV